MITLLCISCSDPTMMHCRPLRERVFRGTICTTTGSVVTATGAYKKWSGDRMDKAVKAVVGGGKSIRRAAMQYNVPRLTLFDRVSRRVQQGAVSGPPMLVQNMIKSTSHHPFLHQVAISSHAGFPSFL